MKLFKFFSNLKPAASQERMIHQKPLAVHRPSLWSSIQKGGMGVVVLGFHYLLDAFEGYPMRQDRSTVSDLAETTGFALMLDSTFEIATEGLVYISGLLASQNDFENDRHMAVVIGNKKHKRKVAQANARMNHALVSARNESVNDPEREAKKEMERYLTLLRYKNIGRAGINTIVTLFTTFRYLINLHYLPVGTSAFDLRWPEGTELQHVGPILKYINVPILNPISILFLSMATLYNGREFFLSLGPSLRRAENPVVGLFNGYAYIGATAEMTRSFWKTEALINIPLESSLAQISQILSEMHASLTDAVQTRRPSILLLRTLNTIPSYHVYKNCLEIFYNSRYLFFQETIQPAIDVEPKFVRPHKAKGFLPNYTALSNATVFPENIFIDVKSGVLESENASLVVETDSKAVPEEEFEIKTKIKRRSSLPAFSNLVQAQNSRLENQDNPENVLYPIENREERLAEIRSLREYNQINTREIQQKLKEVVQILPKGQIVGIGGSESRLEWYWKKQRFSIKFEDTHGRDANQFTGRKLVKVINVLEVVYLWGWGTRERADYLRTYCHTDNLKRLTYIFGARPKF